MSVLERGDGEGEDTEGDGSRENGGMQGVREKRSGEGQHGQMGRKRVEHTVTGKYRCTYIQYTNR